VDGGQHLLWVGVLEEIAVQPGPDAAHHGVAVGVDREDQDSQLGPPRLQLCPEPDPVAVREIQVDDCNVGCHGSGDRLGDGFRDAVVALVTVLKALGAWLKDVGRSVGAHLGEHPDANILTSLPRSGQINAAQMLALWGDCRQAYDGPESVATRASGTLINQGVRQAPRRALPRGLQQALPRRDHHLRRQQPPREPMAAHVYADARARGHDHPHAVGVLARALIHVRLRYWIDKSEYSAIRHGNAARLTKPGQPELVAADIRQRADGRPLGGVASDWHHRFGSSCPATGPPVTLRV
jgi:hypothetical protein